MKASAGGRRGKLGKRSHRGRGRNLLFHSKSQETALNDGPREADFASIQTGILSSPRAAKGDVVGTNPEQPDRSEGGLAVGRDQQCVPAGWLLVRGLQRASCSALHGLASRCPCVLSIDKGRRLQPNLHRFTQQVTTQSTGDCSFLCRTLTSLKTGKLGAEGTAHVEAIINKTI